MANYEEFVDPNSAIARIIQQMQAAAHRSNPNIQREIQGALQPGGAQAPVGVGPGQNEVMVGEEDPNELIARLLEGQVNR
jgi:hypothetical protein